MGSSSVRLVLLFAVPVLVGGRAHPAAVTLLAALAVLWLLPPVLVADLVPRDAVRRARGRRRCCGRLADRGPAGRIEVVPEHGHEESLWVAQGVPLARGWLRQLDTAAARSSTTDRWTPRGYLDWLRAAGASYVALPPGRLDWPSGGEARLLRRGVPGLQKVWSDRWWRLFQVSGGGVVHGDGTLVSSDRSRLVVDVPRREGGGRAVVVAVVVGRGSGRLRPAGTATAGRRSRPIGPAGTC